MQFPFLCNANRWLETYGHGKNDIDAKDRQRNMQGNFTKERIWQSADTPKLPSKQ